MAAHLASDCGRATFAPSSSCADATARLGWPLQFYEPDGFIYHQTFNTLYFFIESPWALLLHSQWDGYFLEEKDTSEIIPLCYNAVTMETLFGFVNDNNSDNNDLPIVGRSLAG